MCKMTVNEKMAWLQQHAPGNTRKVRRAVQRQFDKTFKIFRKHCQDCNIQYSFQQPNK